MYDVLSYIFLDPKRIFLGNKYFVTSTSTSTSTKHNKSVILYYPAEHLLRV